MFDSLKLLKTVSRPEFLPANCSSLVMGLAWGIDPSMNSIWETALLSALVLAVLTFVSAIGAQLNTLSDHELDSKEPRKRYLVEALEALGQGRLERIMLTEFVLGLPFFILLIFVQPKLVLVLLWVLGHFMAYAYSASPLRLKCRSWLAMLSLFVVLSVLPVSFVYYTFTDALKPVFLLFLVGEAMNVYAVIIPTETRDYWIDKANDVNTMTVRLGLVKASLLAMALLIAGGTLMATAFVITVSDLLPVLMVSLLAIVVADTIILRNYWKLYKLSKQHSITGDSSIAEEIVDLSARNPRWINLAQQSIVILALMLIVAKFWPFIG
jgi:4-hydroxybenzoate polyprenyltransferase